jgi:hypothetical protein
MRTPLVTLALVLAGCAANVDGASDDDAAALLAGTDEPGDMQAAVTQPAECTQATWGTSEVCKTANGEAGARLCQERTEGEGSAQTTRFAWSDCLPTRLCQPGQTRSCSSPYGAGSDVCTVMGDAWGFTTSGCNTPLVLAFGPAPVVFTNPAGAFDVAGRETLVTTTWVSSATPWLVFDRNSNGTVDDGAELFGSMTRLPDGQRAQNGFLALEPLDADGDGWITPRDPAFARLALWRDGDQDRVSSPDELSPLADSVLALSLADVDRARCFDGSCERERADFVFLDRAGHEQHGSLIDVTLAER